MKNIILSAVILAGSTAPLSAYGTTYILVAEFFGAPDQIVKVFDSREECEFVARSNLIDAWDGTGLELAGLTCRSN